MFETLKNMFCSPDVKPDVHPTVKRLDDAKHDFDSKVKAAKESLEEDIKEKKLDISEPVVSFIETVKKNPRRFKYTSSDKFYGAGNPFYVYYEVLDKQAKYQFGVFTVPDIDKDGCMIVSYLPLNTTSWMTEDEARYAFEVLKPFFKTYTEGRIERINAHKRKKLMSIYCAI